METYGIYCLKTGLILLLFLGIYCVCLRKETFYRFNRFFLLAGLFAALLLPLIPIRYTVEISLPDSIAVSHPVTDADPAARSAGGSNSVLRSYLLSLCHKWLPAIYLTGLCAFLIIRLGGLWHLLRFIRKNSHRKFPRYRLIESADFKGAFSFFHFIFIPAHLNDTEKKPIIKHEEAHIVQKHWADLLLLELLCLAWWFNPLIRLYGKMIRNNHEYLADQAVLANYGQAFYRKVLVNQWFKMPVFPFAHSFSYSNPLKRIQMMKKNNSNPVKKHLSLLVLPPLAAFLWIFAEPEYVRAENRESTPDNDPTPALVTTADVSDNYPEDELVLTADYLPFASAEQFVTTVFETDTLPVATAGKEADSAEEKQYSVKFPGGSATIHKTNGAPLLIINGKKSDKKIEDIDPESIISVSVRVNAVEEYGNEGKNGVLEIKTKPEYSDEKMSTTILSDISIGHANDSLIITTESLSSYEQGKKPLIIVDDEPLVQQDLNSIKPEDILSFSVLKRKAATDRFGESGKNGVILITTKKKKLENN
jgi:hypothetical protein